MNLDTMSASGESATMSATSAPPAKQDVVDALFRVASFSLASVYAGASQWHQPSISFGPFLLWNFVGQIFPVQSPFFFATLLLHQWLSPHYVPPM